MRVAVDVDEGVKASHPVFEHASLSSLMLLECINCHRETAFQTHQVSLLCAVLGRFLHSLNKFCEEEYGLHFDIPDYSVYEFAKVGD